MKLSRLFIQYVRITFFSITINENKREREREIGDRSVWCMVCV